MAEETTTTSNNKEVEEGKVCAILAWIFPVGLIWYLVDEKMKKNSFARVHVQQSLILAIVSIIVSVAGSIIPIIGWFLVLPIGSLAVLVLWLIGIINALSGKSKELPIIGKYGSKFNI